MAVELQRRVGVRMATLAVVVAWPLLLAMPASAGSEEPTASQVAQLAEGLGTAVQQAAPEGGLIGEVLDHVPEVLPAVPVGEPDSHPDALPVPVPAQVPPDALDPEAVLEGVVAPLTDAVDGAVGVVVGDTLDGVVDETLDGVVGDTLDGLGDALGGAPLVPALPTAAPPAAEAPPGTAGSAVSPPEPSGPAPAADPAGLGSPGDPSVPTTPATGTVGSSARGSAAQDPAPGAGPPALPVGRAVVTAADAYGPSALVLIAMVALLLLPRGPSGSPLRTARADDDLQVFG